MISKELLSAVLGKDVKSINANTDNRIVAVNYDEKYNIHELAHMVKEWARDNGYTIETYITHQGRAKVFKHGFKDERYEYKTVANIEPEAIFKAGEWILKEISK